MQFQDLPAIAVLCAVWLMCCPAAHAGEQVWSAMLFAKNTETDKPFPAELANFKEKLEHIFGYKRFGEIDSRTEVMEGGEEHSILLGKHFSLRMAVTARTAEKAVYDLRIELFREKKQLLDMKAMVAVASPLFIRGPQCGEGQLIFVILIKPRTHQSAARSAGNAESSP